jgi:hypothetical protein
LNEEEKIANSSALLFFNSIFHCSKAELIVAIRQKITFFI